MYAHNTQNVIPKTKSSKDREKVEGKSNIFMNASAIFPSLLFTAFFERGKVEPNESDRYEKYLDAVEIKELSHKSPMKIKKAKNIQRLSSIN